MSDALDKILAAAKEGAANVPALNPQTNGSLVQTGTSGGSLSMDDVANSGGMDVEGYVNVNAFGIRLGKDWKGFLSEIEATIDLRDVQAFQGIQKTVGKNVEYAKTYNGSTSTRSEPWSQVVAQYKAESQKDANTYPGADIPVTLTQSYADPSDPKKEVEADTTLGITTSITGFKPWKTFWKRLSAAGLTTSTIKVKIKHGPRTNTSGQDYGVYEFEMLELIEDRRPAALEAPAE